MTTTPKILAFAGSARSGSYNLQLVKIAAAGAKAAGAEVTVIDFRDLPMPLYGQDLEAESGIPEHVRTFQGLLKSHHGLLISCPEYNSSITPLLKNAIDWATRIEPGKANLECFEGKVATLMSASPGGLGGMRGLVHVRSILSSIGVLVLPAQKAISKSFEAFDEAGQLTDPGQQAAVEQLGHGLVDTVGKLL